MAGLKISENFYKDTHGGTYWKHTPSRIFSRKFPKFLEKLTLGNLRTVANGNNCSGRFSDNIWRKVMENSTVTNTRVGMEIESTTLGLSVTLQ